MRIASGILVGAGLLLAAAILLHVAAVSLAGGEGRLADAARATCAACHSP